MIKRNSLGVCLRISEIIIPLMQILLPDPVLPATSRCGILVISAIIALPDTSLPNGNFNLPRLASNSSLCITSRIATIAIEELGISMPTTERPGTGASIRIEGAANANAKSLCKLVILLIFTPIAGCKANCVTAGPVLASTTRASTLNEASVSSMMRAFSRFSSSLIKPSVNESSIVSDGNGHAR